MLKLFSRALMISVFALCLVCTSKTRAQSADLVGKMAANEVAARAQDKKYGYLSEERSARTGGHLWREKVVETEDGPLHRLLAVDGKLLDAAQTKAEADRIDALVRDPAAFREANLAHKDDEARAANLLALLPRAFILAPAGEQSGCVQIAFQPNPAFKPSTYEERVAHAMGGTVSLKEPMDRLCSLSAKIETPVVFGFGLLGRIESGGYFALERVPVTATDWKSARISVHVQGRILMLKSLTREQQIRRTAIVLIPQHLSLADAARLSLP